MKVIISTPTTIEYDGEHYYSNSVCTAWNRYHQLGDECVVICHVKNVAHATNNKIDDSAKFVFVKKVNTVKAIIRNYSSFNMKIIDKYVKNADLCIVHIPKDHGYQIIKCCKKYNKPYLSVVCGCPWDAFWNHGWRGKIMAPYEYFKLKYYLKHSNYTIYVTNEFLQHRYPTDGKSIGCSNVNICTGDIEVLEKKKIHITNRPIENPLKICTAAAIDVSYKGQEYVIRAIARLKEKGLNFEYHLIGRGSEERLKKIAIKEGVENIVFFHGAIPHDCVLNFLDSMDIYIQPSKQEGLPRALIEGMSRGLLCLGSRTAGIPELLENDFVFSKGNVNEIVNILSKITTDKLLEQADRNFEKAKEFDKEVLNKRRKMFIDSFLKDSRINNKV